MLIDSFGRPHQYLRISLTERCNLRCFYCMPAEGIQLSPSQNIMQAHEIEKIAQGYVQLGVNKIRLTGGEPLVRKDFSDVYERLSKLPVQLAITTNGILLDQYLPLFEKTKMPKINISLDTLDKKKFFSITRRDYFDKVWSNIQLLLEKNIHPKINVVLIKGTNDDEINDFIALTKDFPLNIQFIEFMPFQGNQWNWKKGFSFKELMSVIGNKFGAENILPLQNIQHSTSRNFHVIGHLGNFGIVSTITNPFCDSCNRIRLTANGRVKNCLFSNNETDLLTALRDEKNLIPLMEDNIRHKKQQRGGKKDFTHEAKNILEDNRSMVLIGG